jgi:hypothetical protein
VKNILILIAVFACLVGFAGILPAWEGNTDKSPANTGASPFDESTAQYLKKFRGINSELVAAYQELNRYNNPDRSTKGVSLEDLLDQQSVAQASKNREQVLQDKKAGVEARIGELQKAAQNLKSDLIKYHSGKLPKNVSDAWKTEEDYTEYRISKLR